MTTFKPHPNNVISTLGSAYTSGSGSLVLTSPDGSLFGSTFPMLVTVATAATFGTPGEINTIFTVTGRTGNTLTGVAAAEGTIDRNYAIGDRVGVRWTSGLATAIEAAVNGVENSTGITAGVIAPARLGSGTPSNQAILRGDGVWAQPWVDATVTKTANYTMTPADTFVACNSASGPITITLPGATASVNVERIIIKNDSSTNAVTVLCSGTDQFFTGATSYPLSAQFKFVRLISKAGAWLIVGGN